jgi:hypothetical protein
MNKLYMLWTTIRSAGKSVTDFLATTFNSESSERRERETFFSGASSISEVEYLQQKRARALG